MVISATEFFTVAMILVMPTLLTMTMGKAKAEGKTKAKNRLIAQSAFSLFYTPEQIKPVLGSEFPSPAFIFSGFRSES